jgi:hypothetical protein
MMKMLAAGRGVKILSPLVASLPGSYNYSVIYMLRHLREVIAAQDAMLARAGEPTQVTSVEALIAEYDAHLRRTRALLADRACFDTLYVDYADAIVTPRAVAERVNVFCRRPRRRSNGRRCQRAVVPSAPALSGDGASVPVHPWRDVNERLAEDEGGRHGDGNEHPEQKTECARSGRKLGLSFETSGEAHSQGTGSMRSGGDLFQVNWRVIVLF